MPEYDANIERARSLPIAAASIEISDQSLGSDDRLRMRNLQNGELVIDKINFQFRDGKGIYDRENVQLVQQVFPQYTFERLFPFKNPQCIISEEDIRHLRSALFLLPCLLLLLCCSLNHYPVIFFVTKSNYKLQVNL